MRKWLYILSFLATWGFGLNANLPYDAAQREFQSALEQIIQDFTQKQAALGHEVIVTFYNADGQVEFRDQTPRATPFLETLSTSKMNFMKSYKLFSTQGIYAVQIASSSP